MYKPCINHVKPEFGMFMEWGTKGGTRIFCDSWSMCFTLHTAHLFSCYLFIMIYSCWVPKGCSHPRLSWDSIASSLHEYLPIGCGLRMASVRCSPACAQKKTSALVAKATQDLPAIVNTLRVQKMLGSEVHGLQSSKAANLDQCFWWCVQNFCCFLPWFVPLMDFPTKSAIFWCIPPPEDWNITSFQNNISILL